MMKSKVYSTSRERQYTESGELQYTKLTHRDEEGNILSEQLTLHIGGGQDNELDEILLSNSYWASPPTDVGKMFEIGLNEEGIESIKLQLNALIDTKVNEAKQEFRDKFGIDPTKKYHVVGSDKAVIITEWEHYQTLKSKENK